MLDISYQVVTPIDRFSPGFNKSYKCKRTRKPKELVIRYELYIRKGVRQS